MWLELGPHPYPYRNSHVSWKSNFIRHFAREDPRWAFVRYILMLQYSVTLYLHSMNAYQNRISCLMSPFAVHWKCNIATRFTGVHDSFTCSCSMFGTFSSFVVFLFSILYSNSSSVRKFIFYFICSCIENSFRSQSDVPNNRLNHAQKCIWMNKREKWETLNVEFNIWFEFIEIHRTCFDTGL